MSLTYLSSKVLYTTSSVICIQSCVVVVVPFQKFVGLNNALMIGIGLLGATCAAVYADRTKKFVEVAKCGLSLSVVSFIGFLLVWLSNRLKFVYNFYHLL